LNGAIMPRLFDFGAAYLRNFVQYESVVLPFDAVELCDHAGTGPDRYQNPS
jgi:hypothetical protein